MPAPSSFFFDNLKARLGSGFDWTAIDAELLLLDAAAGWTPSRTTGFVSELAAYELETDNYARQNIGSRSIDEDNVNHLARWLASGPVFPDLGPATGGPVVGGGIVIERITDDTDSRPLLYLPTIVGTVNGTDWTVTFPAGGVAVLREPSA